MKSYSIRAWLRFGLCLLCSPACCALTPQVYVNPTPLRLPVGHANDVRFALISTADGLSQIRVNNILQDNLGFLWFGTLFGLNRFDGYAFKVFLHEPNNPNSLSGVDVNALFKDRDGALWIGCEQALDRLDPKTETFVHYPVPMVKYISQDRAGLLWLSTANGLYRLDEKNGNIRLYAHDPHDPEGLRNNDVLSAAEDKTGRFWVAGSDGMDEFDRETGHVKLHIPIDNPSRDFSFYEDRFGVFWIFYASRNGLASFDRDRNVLTHYSLYHNGTSSTAYSGVTAILEDRHGNLWLATQGFGLVKFDREHRRFITYRYTPGDSDGLAEDRITTLYEDRDGGIWAALFGKGLQRFVPTPTPFQAVSPKAKAGGIGWFYEDKHRNLWMGTRFAVYRVDPSGASSAFVGVKRGVPFDVISIVEDRAGFIWIGTFNNGLFRLDPEMRQWKNYRHKENDPGSLSSNIVNRLLVDRDGILWAATWDGLNRFDRHSERFTTFRANPHNRALIYLAMAEGLDHDLWLGTYGFGLQHFDTSTTQFTTYSSSDGPGGLSDNQVNGLYVAHSGAIWLATQNGLNEFDPGTKGVTAYGTRDGLASSAASCVLDDMHGKLWLSTHKGISSLDLSTRTFRNFSKADGLPGPDMAGWGACMRSASGRMFVAGFSGATTFLPEAMPESPPPPIVITDFRLMGSSRSPAAQLKGLAISYTSDITLSHEQNLFSLTFAALAYSNSQTNRYRYMMERLDNQWNEVGSDSRSVTYTSLPAGKYRFRVQGATSSSQWSQPGAELQIIILPPWWATLWFRAVCALAALVLILFVYRYHMLQLARQFEIRLESRVNERTRIARELHDTLLQSFHGRMFEIQAARNMFARNPEKAMEALDSAILATDEAIVEGRNAIQDLRSQPVALGDLAQSLTSASQQLGASYHTGHDSPTFRMVVEGDGQNLSPLLRDEVYRIGCEALRNAFRHARASQIEAEIRYDVHEFRLRIRDDGMGIDPKVLVEGGINGHWGLSGIRERANQIGAQLKLWSEAGVGTEVQLTIPAALAYEASRDRSRFKFLRRVRKS